MQEHEIYHKIGRNIYLLRKQRKMTQESLAQLLRLSRTSVSNMEKGTHRIQIHILYQIAEVLGAPVLYLITFDDVC